MTKALRYSLLFAGLGALLYLPFLGGVHLFDWDEINFAEISREMMIQADYLRIYVNFQPFWEKPPFYFWTQAAAMHTLGVGEYAARLPNAICGMLTLVVLFHMGRRLYNVQFGLIWATVYLGTILPLLYFKSGIIDPWFNLFIFLGMYFFILGYWRKSCMAEMQLRRSRWWYFFLGGFFVGMAILTKGQTAFIIAGLTMAVYWVSKRFRFYVNVPEFLVFAVATTLVTLAWYGLETWAHGPWFITEFNRYQYRLFSTPDAGHVGFPGYHMVVLLLGCFPASIFAIRSFFRSPVQGPAHMQDFGRWMKYLFWVVLILFSIVQSKIVHYSSMCYFPLSFLSALVLYRIIKGELQLARWMKAGLLGIGGLFAMGAIAMPIAGMNAERLKPLFADPFARANLDADVSWTGLEVIPGIVLLAGLIVALVLYRRGRAWRATITLFGSTALFVFLGLVFFIGRVEGYSQRAAIEFFKEKSGEDVYFTAYAYKTYAQFFYTRKQPQANPKAYDHQWLMNGDIDKDVYIVAKVHRAPELMDRPDFEVVKEKNGFVFFLRRARHGP